MRKRTRYDLIVRNDLSELLRGALERPERSLAVGVIHEGLKSMKQRGAYKVSVSKIIRALPPPERKGYHEKELLFELRASNLFSVNIEGDEGGEGKEGDEIELELNQSCRGDLDFIITRLERYRKALGSMSITGGGSTIEGQIKKGAVLFNASLYFECHEYLEDTWRGEAGNAKSFIKAIIHAAVGMYHYEHENTRGLLSYLRRARRALEPFKPHYLGIDVKSLINELEGFERLIAEGAEQNKFANARPPVIRAG